MAEDKTFRYGFIMLGFFLVMTGMFIMSVEKPQIYITFCALGVLLIAVGITWSMCQCYPKRALLVRQDSHASLPRETELAEKAFFQGESGCGADLGTTGWPGHTLAAPQNITFIPVNLEAEQFLDHKSIVLPEGDTCLIAACPKQEATSTYEQSLPSYEQTQGQALGSAPLPPTAHPRPHRCSQPAVQAKAEVHRELGGAGDPPQELAPRMEEAEGSCSPWTAPGAAPLASLLEDMDTPSLGGSVPSSPVPQGRHPPSAAHSGCTLTSSPARGEHSSSSHEGAGEEDDFYYGLQEGLDSLLKDSDCLFEPEN